MNIAGWQLVPVVPNALMTRAFAVEIRRQAARLDPASTAHEPLAPLWAAVLAAAPIASPQHMPCHAQMPHNAIEGWNAALGQMIAIAQASGDVLRNRLTERPTRFNYAIAALDGLVEAAGELVLPLPPDGPEAVAVALPKPNPPLGGASVQVVA